MTLSFRQIRYFVATAELGQISQAAIDLSISQSAITTAIKDLERIVGASLFLRTSHGMDLTPAGRQFLSHAYEILKKVDEATHLNVVSSEIEGTLTVAATYTVIGYFLPLHIELLYHDYQTTGAFAAAFILTLLAVVTIIAKVALERRGAGRRRRAPIVTPAPEVAK